MRTPKLRTFVRAIVVSLVLALPQAAVAQPAHGVVAEFAGGVLVFPDDAVVREAFVGGSIRYQVLPRLSIGPEFAYVSADRHSHVMLTGNATFDFVGPDAGEPAPLTPFVVVGGGLFRTRELFPSGAFSSSEGAFTAGGGVRAALNQRFLLGAEARVGWELHLRLNAFMGVRL